ncbi:HAMP domain-containing histidine kinase [Sulfurimonas lithotrophica]|uniref:histidine kinase n=1 Tax=Sulfurimonas lithotrophica TaxID=2590022 RepID=A0A5P8NYT4_9BACT|nr:HAMP domain-containing sensor histidine kinase [Sulfurimonas lithotrophica]QFR48592.1 HAMP domain-containing histidine kinase [Sulfurimonas lithotrophica]
MSVLKSLDIDLPQSEKKTLFRFLFLYIFFTLVILLLTASIYYKLQKELAASQRSVLLSDYTNHFISDLKGTDANISKLLKDKNYEVSLYADNYKLLYSNAQKPIKSLTKITDTINKTIRYMTNPKEYYLNTHYVLVEIIDDKKWLKITIKNIIIYSLVFFTAMIVIGYFLLKLFLKPMRDALHLLDTFIKDTTHELNTPVSTIMTNIELIDKENIEDKYLVKILNRIEIGTKTISNIYDDLSFLILNNKVISNNQDINLKNLIEQRVEYFYILANIKKIKVTTKLNPNIFLNIDEKKISKLIDNILSNAIKYNKIGGSIYIKLDEGKLSIIDSGKGIKQENINLMFDRYARFDKIVGGFGIGLNIVKMICDEYDLSIKIDSEPDKYTQVTISW